VSHHSLTAFGRVALAPADLVVPSDLPAGLSLDVHEKLRQICPPHRIVTAPSQDLEQALLALPVKLSTMGRGYAEDRAYFLSAAAAGRVAASGLGERGVGDGL
jgi:hypothetical protein